MMLRLIGGGVAAVAAPMGSVLVRAAALPYPLAIGVRRTNLVVMTFPPVGYEADLAIKEEQAMSERLRGTRGFSLTIVVAVAVLSIVAFVSLPLATAAQGKSIVQMVRAAKTPADQRASSPCSRKRPRPRNRRPR